MQAKPYLSGEILVKDDLVVTINAAQSGIVYADISTLLNPLGWEVFSQVRSRPCTKTKIAAFSSRNTPR